MQATARSMTPTLVRLRAYATLLAVLAVTWLVVGAGPAAATAAGGTATHGGEAHSGEAHGGDPDVHPTQRLLQAAAAHNAANGKAHSLHDGDPDVHPTQRLLQAAAAYNAANGIATGAPAPRPVGSPGSIVPNWRDMIENHGDDGDDAEHAAHTAAEPSFAASLLPDDAPLVATYTMTAAPLLLGLGLIQAALRRRGTRDA